MGEVKQSRSGNTVATCFPKVHLGTTEFIRNEFIETNYNTFEMLLVTPSNMGLLKVHPFSGLVVSK